MSEHEITIEEKTNNPTGWQFTISVSEEGDSDSVTNHEVKVSEKYSNKLIGGQATPKELVQESFRFLLERESKEAILGQFSLSDISTYFSEYEEEISKRLV